MCYNSFIVYACSMQKNNNICKENMYFFIYIYRFYFNWVQIVVAIAFNMADLPELETWVSSMISQTDDKAIGANQDLHRVQNRYSQLSGTSLFRFDTCAAAGG